MLFLDIYQYFYSYFLIEWQLLIFRKKFRTMNITFF